MNEFSFSSWKHSTFNETLTLNKHVTYSFQKLHFSHFWKLLNTALSFSVWTHNKYSNSRNYVVGFSSNTSNTIVQSYQCVFTDIWKSASQLVFLLGRFMLFCCFPKELMSYQLSQRRIVVSIRYTTNFRAECKFSPTIHGCRYGDRFKVTKLSTDTLKHETWKLISKLPFG